MNEIQLGVIESKFADIIWSNEPLRPKELEALAEAELGWKRTTTLTILKRLGERGLFQNKERIITSLISREEFYALQSEKFVNDTFEEVLKIIKDSLRSQINKEHLEKSHLKNGTDFQGGLLLCQGLDEILQVQMPAAHAQGKFHRKRRKPAFLDKSPFLLPQQKDPVRVHALYQGIL